jgi:hypothetical protein
MMSDSSLPLLFGLEYAAMSHAFHRYFTGPGLLQASGVPVVR